MRSKMALRGLLLSLVNCTCSLLHMPLHDSSLSAVTLNCQLYSLRHASSKPPPAPPVGSVIPLLVANCRSVAGKRTYVHHVALRLPRLLWLRHKCLLRLLHE